MSDRKLTLEVLKKRAKAADQNGDIVKREIYSNNWRDLATYKECEKAPKYLTWTTRRNLK